MSTNTAAHATSQPAPGHLDVLVFGSTNLDVVVRTQRIPGPGETVLGHSLDNFAGGKGLNQAVAAARSGAATGFATALGDDSAAAMLQTLIRDEGIDDRWVTSTDQRTGHAFITVDDSAENSIVVVPGANALLAAIEPVEVAVVLAQLEVPLDAVTATLIAAHDRGCTVVLNPAPAAPLPAALVAACDVIIPNEHELEILGGSDRLLEMGCETIVVTQGARGAAIVTAAGSVQVPPFAVSPIDTTGAGDAFCGSFSARLAAGDTVDEAALWAAAAGALATTTPGAVPAQPTADAIRALLADQSTH